MHYRDSKQFTVTQYV